MSSQNSEKSELNSAESKEIVNIPGYGNVEQFTKDGFKILMEAIRNSNGLPNGRDWNFYNTHESFSKIMNSESSNVLRLMNSILRVHDVEGNIRNKLLDEKIELIVEANDVILEKVANNIDEMNGVKKSTIDAVEIQTVSAKLPINGSWNRISNVNFSISSNINVPQQKVGQNSIRLLTAKNIVRPQKFFKDKIDNSSKPWIPRITDKPNSLKPLAIFLESTVNGEEYSHPYEFELERFTPTEEQLKPESPFIPKLLSDTPLIEISKPEQLDELVETLRKCKEIAIDLEHHSYRTFMGITCLMQISTRESDYLIDTLALRDKLYVLNEVFTKPTIVKIFHGADMDIQWLQRDLSLYIVNMFDTHQAAKILGYSGLSLAYLMNRFCNFMPNKQFQLADWRIRPLPDELKNYAREDTHYLIYIYHMLKEELLAKGNGADNILKSVIQLSTQVCLKRYLKPILREDSYMDFYRKCKRLFDNRQLYALRELYTWRDTISREEDESTGYILPNHMLLQISEALPREMQGILACCNPVPPLVKSNLLELHHIILRSREQPLVKPILKEDSRARGSTQTMVKINVDSPLHCPHDLTKTPEFRDDLPTLLGDLTSNTLKPIQTLNIDLKKKLKIERNVSSYSVFDSPESSDSETENEKCKNIRKIKFMGPYERYKLVIPFIQAEEEKMRADEEMAKENLKTLETQSEDIQKTSTKTDMAIQKDERTDEDRINAIRDHFLSLSRKTAEDVQIKEEKSLIQMGGSKKRKRDLSLDNNYHTYFQLPQDNFQTPIPNPHQFNFNRNNKGKKRTSSEAFSNDTQGPQDKRNIQQNTPNKKKNIKWKKNIANKNNNGPNQNNETQNESDINQQQNNAEHNKKKKRRRGKHPDRQQNHNVNRPNFGGHSQPHCSNTNLPDSHNNPDRSFETYNYASVDFRQFSGGAGNVQPQQQFRTTFKSKGARKRNNKGSNKASTFAGNNRGRGR